VKRFEGGDEGERGEPPKKKQRATRRRGMAALFPSLLFCDDPSPFPLPKELFRLICLDLSNTKDMLSLSLVSKQLRKWVLSNTAFWKSKVEILCTPDDVTPICQTLSDDLNFCEAYMRIMKRFKGEYSLDGPIIEDEDDYWNVHVDFHGKVYWEGVVHGPPRGGSGKRKSHYFDGSGRMMVRFSTLEEKEAGHFVWRGLVAFVHNRGSAKMRFLDPVKHTFDCEADEGWFYNMEF